MVKKKRDKKLVEKMAAYLFSISGGITGVIFIFIVIFLFKEGAGLFQSPTVEKGYSIYLNATNPVSRLTPLEIKSIFDAEMTNWNEVGGDDQPIMTYRIDDLFKTYSEKELGDNYELLPGKLEGVIEDNPNIIAFLPDKYAPVHSWKVKKIPYRDISFTDVFLGKEWLPTATPSPLFGALPLILGTLLVSSLAILFALPIGLGVAIYLSELATINAKKVMKPVIELLAGIPSVVYGFFGLVILAPIIKGIFQLPVGETASTGSIILAIMALPTIISVAEDALNNTPRDLKEASIALGATKWQTIHKVIIPYAKSGIVAAVVLGIGRAVGETMAVLMVTGNAAVMPTTALESVRTIPATIAAELGEAPTGGAHYQSLFLLGCILFLITTVTSVGAALVSKKQ